MAAEGGEIAQDAKRKNPRPPSSSRTTNRASETTASATNTTTKESDTSLKEQEDNRTVVVAAAAAASAAPAAKVQTTPGKMVETDHASATIPTTSQTDTTNSAAAKTTTTTTNHSVVVGARGGEGRLREDPTTTSTTTTTTTSPKVAGLPQHQNRQNSTVASNAGWNDSSSGSSTSSSSGTTSRSSSASPWVVGNVREDLDRLERAIRIHRAEELLEQQERVDTLQYMSRNKRTVRRDVAQYLVPCYTASLVLAILTRTTWALTTLRTPNLIVQSSALLLKTILSIIYALSDAHFWSIIIASPVISSLFLFRGEHEEPKWRNRLWKRRWQYQQPSTPFQQDERDATNEGEGDQQTDTKMSNNRLLRDVLESDYRKFVVSDEDHPRTSCADYARCIMEQWTSSVAGIVIALGIVPILVQHVLPCLINNAMSLATATATSTRSSQAMTTKILPALVSLPLVQLLTRFGAYASLKQYPKLWYQLSNPNQPRPLPWRVWYTQMVTNCQWFPWTVIPCLTESILAYSGKSWFSIFGIYAVLGSILGVIWRDPQVLVTSGIIPRMRDDASLRKKKQQQQQQEPSIYSESVKRTVAITLLIIISKYLPMMIHAYRDGVATLSTQTTTWGSIGRAMISKSVLRKICCGVALLVASVGPVAHILAFRKLLRISNTSNNLSLGLGTDAYMQALEMLKQSDNGQEQQKQWRWRLYWRDPPRRVRVVVSNAWKGFVEWFLFSGSVQDKLRKQYRTAKVPGQEARRQGVHALQKVSEDLLYYPDYYSLEQNNRDTWKRRAMESMERKHDRDYRRKPHEDPLGVAVYKTFGIGLGFNFEHNRELSEGEIPSLRRLQARAAKSAIRRAGELHNATNIVAKDTNPELGGNQTNAEQLQHEEMAKREMDDIAKRLSELIPTDMRLQDSISRTEGTNANNNRRIELGFNRPSPALERLFRNYGDAQYGNDDYFRTSDIVEGSYTDNTPSTKSNSKSGVNTTNAITVESQNIDDRVEEEVIAEFENKGENSTLSKSSSRANETTGDKVWNAPKDDDDDDKEFVKAWAKWNNHFRRDMDGSGGNDDNDEDSDKDKIDIALA